MRKRINVGKAGKNRYRINLKRKFGKKLEGVKEVRIRGQIFSVVKGKKVVISKLMRQKKTKSVYVELIKVKDREAGRRKGRNTLLNFFWGSGQNKDYEGMLQIAVYSISADKTMEQIRFWSNEVTKRFMREWRAREIKDYGIEDDDIQEIIDFLDLRIGESNQPLDKEELKEILRMIGENRQNPNFILWTATAYKLGRIYLKSHGHIALDLERQTESVITRTAGNNMGVGIIL